MRRRARCYATRVDRRLRLAAFCFLTAVPLLVVNNHTLADPVPAPPAEPAERPAEPDEAPAAAPAPSMSNLVFARMAENPVSGITRVPVLNLVNFGIPPKDRVAYSLVLAPTIPVRFKGGWKIITRTTIPAVVTVPFGPGQDPMRPVDVDERTTGFGDMGLEILGTALHRFGKPRQALDQLDLFRLGESGVQGDGNGAQPP